MVSKVNVIYISNLSPSIFKQYYTTSYIVKEPNNHNQNQKAFSGSTVVRTCLQCREIDPIQSLGWEHHREKEMATHSSILVWEIPYTGELQCYSPWGHKEQDTTEQLNNKDTFSLL